MFKSSTRSSSPSLDDIRGKLSQFDLYYYNYKFERSIRELRSNVMDYPNKTTANSRCIDNNLRQRRATSRTALSVRRPSHASCPLTQMAPLLHVAQDSSSRLSSCHSRTRLPKGSLLGYKC